MQKFLWYKKKTSNFLPVPNTQQHTGKKEKKKKKKVYFCRSDSEASNKISHSVKERIVIYSTIKMVLFLTVTSVLVQTSASLSCLVCANKIQAYFTYDSTVCSFDVKKRERIWMWPFAVVFQQALKCQVISQTSVISQECSRLREVVALII